MWALWAALAVAGEGGTAPWQNISGVEDFRFRYWRSEDRLAGFEDRPILDYLEAVDHLDLAGTGSVVSLRLRGDAVTLFNNRYILDGELYHERPLYQEGVRSPFPDALFTLEKATLVVQGKPGRVEVGDTYTSFARGWSLNLVRNTNIDVDTSVRGVSGTLHSGRVDVNVLSGWTNPQQVALENPNINVAPDIFHHVNAARVEAFGLGPVNLGAHGVTWQFSRGWEAGQEPFSGYAAPIDAEIVGGNVEASGLGGIDWYVEGDWIGYQAAEIPVKSGGAAYLSASAYPGKLSVLVEGKLQKNTEYLNAFTTANNYEVAAGPTLEYERVITEDSSAAVNSNDLYGGRVKVAWAGSDPMATVPRELVPSLSQAVFRDEDLAGLHFNKSPETISHTIASLFYVRGDVHLLANAGFRVDRRDRSEEYGELGADRTLHADASFSFPIAGEFSAELAPSVMGYHWGVNPQQQADYTDWSAALALKYGTDWSLILYNDYSDNPLVASTGNLGEDLYGAAELQWKPTTSTTVKAFYGAYRAGIRCAGGQCRQLPGFDGARLSVTAAF